MEITRIIHPVGQGGFYSEKLVDGAYEINMIYDCGGNSKALMESYLEHYFSKSIRLEKKDNNTEEKDNKTIDAVFISHMHDDHVNGLEYLLNNFNIRFLFLPQLEKSELLEAFIYNYVYHKESVGNTLISDLYGDVNNRFYLNTNTRIIKVSPQDENSDFRLSSEINDSKDFNILINEESVDYFFGVEKKPVLQPGAKVYFCGEWLFIPFHSPIKQKLIKEKGEFYEFFKKSLNIRDFEVDNFKHIVDKLTKKRCKEVYEEYFGTNHNAYSMTLFSGAVPESIKCYITKMEYYRCYSCYPFMPHDIPNCLYLGDFETQEDLHLKGLRTFYNPLWKTITRLQVPHHGSSFNHSSELYTGDIVQGYISVGEGNKYYHPDINTLIDMKMKGCEPIIVTNSISTIKMFHAIKKKHDLRT